MATEYRAQSPEFDARGAFQRRPFSSESAPLGTNPWRHARNPGRDVEIAAGFGLMDLLSSLVAPTAKERGSRWSLGNSRMIETRLARLRLHPREARAKFERSLPAAPV